MIESMTVRIEVEVSFMMEFEEGGLIRDVIV